MQSVNDKNSNAIETAVEAIDKALASADLHGTMDRWALIGFPKHSNVGDSAIWLGSVGILERVLGSAPHYVGTETEFPDNLNRMMPFGPIFLIGGGNFGDLWPQFHEFRVRLLKSFPDRKIVQLPQSIHYLSPENLSEMKAAIVGHPDFTLFVRDSTSLHFARKNFDCPVFLCPDMAYGIGPLSPTCGPMHEVVALMRTDREAGVSNDIGSQLQELEETDDWVRQKWRLLRRESLMLSVGKRIGLLQALIMRSKERIFYRKAEREVQRGVEILNRGRFVITDRLHAHILCVLIGKPHIVLDNSNGKVFNYISTWDDDGLTACAHSIRAMPKSW